MDPTFGEQIAAHIHLFCSKRIIKEGRYSDDYNRFLSELEQCFDNVVQQNKIVLKGMKEHFEQGYQEK